MCPIEFLQLDHDVGGDPGDARVHEQPEEGVPGAAEVEAGGGGGERRQRGRSRAAVEGDQGVGAVVHEHGDDEQRCGHGDQELKGAAKRHRSA